jgi:hypothetical protein
MTRFDSQQAKIFLFSTTFRPTPKFHFLFLTSPFSTPLNIAVWGEGGVITFNVN